MGNAQLVRWITAKIKGQRNFGRTIKIFKECGADGWIEKYEKVLAQSL